MKKLFLISLLSVQAFSFTLVGSDIATFGKTTVKINVGSQNCTNVTDSPDDLLDLVSEANEKFWNTVATSEIELEVGSLQNVDATFYTNQISNTAASRVPPVSSDILIVCNNNGTTFSFGDTLAVALPNNVSGNTINGAIVAINDTASTKFNSQSRDDKISVLAHEIGHALGLGHSQFQDSLMYSANVSGRVALGQDDWDGITFLYPKEQGTMGLCGTIEDINSKNKGNYIFALAFLMTIIGLFHAGMKRFKEY